MFQRKIIVWLFLFWLIPSLSYAVQKPTEKIRSRLEDAPWIFIHRRENVKLKPDTWKGPQDLSFRYKIKMEEGTVYVWVDVTDDKVFFKDSETIVSDHIEVWLADPRLTEEQRREIHRLNEEIQKLEPKLEDPKTPLDKESTKNLRDFILKIKETIDQHHNNHYYIQLIFNNPNLSSLPPSPLLQNRVSFEYQPKPRGYEFVASIPLYKACDFKMDEIKRIYYLIDVIDVDNKVVNKQENLISSSEQRMYADPSTFNILELNTTYVLPLTTINRLKMRLTDGHFKLVNDEYVYFVRDTLVSSGLIEASYLNTPGFYKPMVLGDIALSRGLEVFPYEKKLLLVQKEKSAILDLKKYIGAEGDYEHEILFQNTTTDNLYLMLKVTGSSNPSGGSHHCGAGEETNVIWIKLSKNLRVEDIKSMRISSCVYTVTTDRYELTEKTLSAEFTSYKDNITLSLFYDSDNPEVGFIMKVSPRKEN
jgi:hypothetical protein